MQVFTADQEEESNGTSANNLITPNFDIEFDESIFNNYFLDNLALNLPEKNYPNELPINSYLIEEFEMESKRKYEESLLNSQFTKINFKELIRNIFYLYLKRILVCFNLCFRILYFISSSLNLKKEFTIKEYFLVFVFECTELNALGNKIHVIRKSPKLKRPYNLPKDSQGIFSRLFDLNYYKVNIYSLFYLIEQQISLKSLIFYKSDLFLFIFFFLNYNFCIFILLAFKDLKFLYLYLCLKNNEFKFTILIFIVEFFSEELFMDRIFKYFIFLSLIFRELFFNRVDLIVFFRYFNMFIVSVHVYFHSLDVFKLQMNFINTELHLNFGCGTFLTYFYLYIAIALAPFYLLVSISFGLYFFLIFVSFSIFSFSIWFFIRQPMLAISINLLCCFFGYIIERSNSLFFEYLSSFFIPIHSTVLVREVSGYNLVVFVINVIISNLVIVYKLSRIGNRVD